MTRDHWKIAVILTLIVAASSLDQPVFDRRPSTLADEASCSTDSECALLCSEADRELPPDHPDYCDGGPSSGARYGLELGRVTWL